MDEMSEGGIGIEVTGAIEDVTHAAMMTDHLDETGTSLKDVVIVEGEVALLEVV